ncbi:bifunctional diaminohydroxyphosphoribosylaminopyrimidine deaminase/5-amino-6-(5-phosphoribosylamino)uracil reductase RibD [Fulvivirgaceae bacterium BMA10]|uniref:Riboflavin biosynthesis protein RibD n=1 Tax=Splendidivirga corallicola TaxID=3051826 RepID=A0ABT8KM47_9BACT|nr:bifunctional diaminohydroxyphosphoribosylaminopyrimidine deaminase/5-amino-6-(5-phosphoribosylamino)uracil reductase RibD [Fulvivirgaceae bacterium BMA10]
MTREELYMLRAIELAENARGSVNPNPMVGCVIVHDNKIIGEGWHQEYGKAHAEVNAILSVKDKTLLANSEVFVSLEPCVHHGKTPPCTDLLIKEKVKKVYIANIDPNPKVQGKGIQKLRDHRVEVVTGVLHDEGRQLNRRFFTFWEKQKPYIILKWAETQDGFIARSNYDSKWISSVPSRKLVHKWRAEEDAILVGTNTAQHDDPKLNVRDWQGKDPIRIVIDKSLRLKQSLNLFDQNQKTICYNLLKEEEKNNLVYVKLNEADFLESMIQDLYQRKVMSVIVEGGASLISAFIKLNFWDEARVFISKKTFGEGIAAPVLNGEISGEEKIEDDLLRLYVKTS